MNQALGGELEQIIKSAEKAIEYGQSDPETALLHARKSADAICRDVYETEYQASPKGLTLGKMIEALSKQRDILPKKVMYALRVIQNFGGANAHENIDECLEPALKFFSIIIVWYFEGYRKIGIPDQIKLKIENKPIFPSTGERVVPLYKFEDYDESTLVRTGESGAIKRKESDIDERFHSFTREITVHHRTMLEFKQIEISFGRIFKMKPFIDLECIEDEGSCEFEIVELRVDGFILKITGWSSYGGRSSDRKLRLTVSGELA